MVFQFGSRITMVALVLFLKGFPSGILAQMINDTLIDGKYACQGSEIFFTCTTRQSPGITWISNAFIGPGGAELTFAEQLHNRGDTQRSVSVPTTVATLVEKYNDGVQVLVSTLRVIATAGSLTPSVTCVDSRTHKTATAKFQLLDVPDIPEIIVAIQISLSNNNCDALMIWQHSNVDRDKRNITQYTVEAKAAMMSPNVTYINDTWISSLFKVPSCGTQNISVVANNSCGKSGRSNASMVSSQISLDLNVSTAECVPTTNPIDACTMTCPTVPPCPESSGPESSGPDSSGTSAAIPLGILAAILFVSTLVLAVLYVYELKKHRQKCETCKVEAKNPLPTPTDSEIHKVAAKNPMSLKDSNTETSPL